MLNEATKWASRSHKIKLLGAVLLISLLAYVAIRILAPKPDIFSAIEDNNAERVRALLKKDPMIVLRAGEGGLLPIHLAAWRGRTAMVELLLDNNAYIHSTVQGQTALHFAARGGHCAVL